MECLHKNTTKKTISHDYFGLIFAVKMDVCSDCGVQIWSNEIRQKRNAWLAEQKRTQRDAFVVQANLSENSRKYVGEMIRTYPGITITTMIRAMTLVFLTSMEKPDASELLERVTKTAVYENLSRGDRSIVKVQFGPFGMLDINSWAKIFQMKSPRIVQEAVYRMTSLHLEQDPVLKSFWELQILPQIALILKSAS